MNPIKTTAHFVGGPWDGRTERLAGTPPVWNVPEPPMPVAIFTDAVAPEPAAFRRVVYEAREVWISGSVRHARYVVVN